SATDCLTAVATAAIAAAASSASAATASTPTAAATTVAAATSAATIASTTSAAAVSAAAAIAAAITPTTARCSKFPTAVPFTTFGPGRTFGGLGSHLVGDAKFFVGPLAAELHAIMLIDIDHEDFHLVPHAAHIADGVDVA